MGKLKESCLKFIFCFIAGLLWGVLIGSVIMSILVSYRMDLFYEEIAYLENTIVDKNEKLEKLEKSINNYNFILKDIEIILDFGEVQISQIDNIEIEKVIKEKFNSSIGKEVKNLDAEILEQVIDNRILKFDDAEYKLNVIKLVLTDILKLWIEVKLITIQ